MASTTTVKSTTVRDLMRILSGYPADLRVVVEGYEGGIDDLEPSDIRQLEIVLDKNTDWWNGRHEATSQGESGTVQALLLGRPHRDDYN